ncbi:MAG: hypothetical protein C0593_12865 [Marinilabiliales bacterium]|nr:MAG: hypothetical protein C0593_12865 [Marinilabiliales bacterium]
MRKIHLFILALLLATAGLQAQQVFLNPDPVSVTEPGEFTLSIEVDDDLTNFRGYRFVFSYDDNLMDFVSAEKGSLFNGFYSYWWRVFDEGPDSLHIECMIFGAGLAVSGPGPVLTMHFQTINEGTSPLHFNDCRIYDVDGLVMPGVTANHGTVNINYTPMVQISGTVSDSASGNALQGVNISFGNGGGNTITDDNGNFLHSLPQGLSGSVVPSNQGYHFIPQLKNYNNIQSDITDVDFQRAPDMISIGGTIADATGNPIPEATIWLGENFGYATVAGTQWLANVPAGTSGTITPIKKGVIFSPETATWQNITANTTGINFTGTPTSQTFTISGTITEAETGAPLQGVTLTFTGNEGSAITNAAGYYSHEVPYAWSGNVFPDIYTHLFTPRKKHYFNVKEDHNNENYAAIIAYHITGHFHDDVVNSDLAGMRLIFSNNGDTATTDANGNYDHKVAKGWTGDAVPALPGFTSTPASRHYDPVYEDKNDHCYNSWAGNGQIGFQLQAGESCTWGAVQKLTAGCCFGSLVAEPGAEAMLEAGENIVLKPGFHAKAGSSVRVFITPLSPPAKVICGPTDEPEINISTERYNAHTVYPNPFRNEVTFTVTAENDNTMITFMLFDLSGNIIARHSERAAAQGVWSSTFNGTALKPGIYFYHINAGSVRYTGKIIKTN